MYKTTISLAAFLLLTILTPVFAMNPDQDPGYILGKGIKAGKRLEDQARKINLYDLFEKAGLKKDQKVADWGTGAGVYLPKLSDVVGDAGSVFAIDNSEDQLNVARKMCLEKKNIVFLNRDACSVTQEDLGGLVDFVLVSLLLTHLPTDKVEKCIKAIGNVLKPGGRVICIDTDKSKSFEACEGTLCTPDQTKFIAAYQGLAIPVGKARGADYTLGSRLSEPFTEQDFKILEQDTIKPILSGIELNEDFFLPESEEWADKLIPAGFVTQEELDEWKRTTLTMTKEQKYFLGPFSYILAQKND